MFKKMLLKFTAFDLVIIALLAAAGVATKPFVRVLAQLLTGTLIPNGAVAGVFYMLWIVLACCIVKKRGTAILFGLVQAILVVAFDMLGNRGPVGNLLVYVTPGIALDLIMLLFPLYVSGIIAAFCAGATANVAGSVIMSLVFMRLPMVPMLIAAVIAAVFGGLGGVLAFKIYQRVMLLKASGGGVGT